MDELNSNKILILGGSGLLGSSLIPYLRNRGYLVEFQGLQHAAHFNVDLSERESTFKLLTLINPSIIINLVGLTDVERCEAQPNQAFMANVRTVENIAAWISRKQFCHLIHISTDQVYDAPYLKNEQQVSLTNYYAFSKYAGEMAATMVPCTILRTNFFGMSLCDKRESFTDWIFRTLSNQECIQVFDDVNFNPISIKTLAKMIELTIKNKPIGIFNLGSHEGMSKANFAFAFAEAANLSTITMARASITQATFIKTYRPRDMRMDCLKFENLLGIKLPMLISEINQVAQEYHEKSKALFRD
jgi:dTDP-4-dehydrorhamnose reductase